MSPVNSARKSSVVTFFPGEHDDGEVIGQDVFEREIAQCRNQLSAGKVARAAEDDHHTGIRFASHRLRSSGADYGIPRCFRE